MDFLVKISQDGVFCHVHCNIRILPLLEIVGMQALLLVCAEHKTYVIHSQKKGNSLLLNNNTFIF